MARLSSLMISYLVENSMKTVSRESFLFLPPLETRMDEGFDWLRGSNHVIR